MKIKLREIVKTGQTKSDTGLLKLLQMDLPAKPAYRLGRLLDGITSEMKRVNKVRDMLLKKYGEQTMVMENGKVVNKDIKVKEEFLETYNKEMNQLLDTEVELWYNPMSLSELGDVSLAPIDMISLIPFFKDIELVVNNN